MNDRDEDSNMKLLEAGYNTPGLDPLNQDTSIKNLKNKIKTDRYAPITESDSHT